MRREKRCLHFTTGCNGPRNANRRSNWRLAQLRAHRPAVDTTSCWLRLSSMVHGLSVFLVEYPQWSPSSSLRWPKIENPLGHVMYAGTVLRTESAKSRSKFHSPRYEKRAGLPRDVETLRGRSKADEIGETLRDNGLTIDTLLRPCCLARRSHGIRKLRPHVGLGLCTYGKRKRFLAVFLVSTVRFHPRPQNIKRVRTRGSYSCLTRGVLFSAVLLVTVNGNRPKVSVLLS